jgi:hypothetical protein
MTTNGKFGVTVILGILTVLGAAGTIWVPLNDRITYLENRRIPRLENSVEQRQDLPIRLSERIDAIAGALGEHKGGHGHQPIIDSITDLETEIRRMGEALKFQLRLINQLWQKTYGKEPEVE